MMVKVSTGQLGYVRPYGFMLDTKRMCIEEPETHLDPHRDTGIAQNGCKSHA